MRIAVVGPMSLETFEPLGIDLGTRTRGYPFGFVADLVVSYLEAGHEVAAITTATDITDPIRQASGALEVRVIPSSARARKRALSLWRVERQALVREIERAAPDVVHAHWTYEFGWSAIASGLPHLVTVHDWAPTVLRHQPTTYRAIRLGIQLGCLIRADSLSAPSPYLADRCHRYLRRSVAVVPNGVTNRSRQQRIPHSNLRFGALNVDFGRRKNVRTLLVAWRDSELWARGCQLVLAGPDYSPNGPAHRIADAMGIADRIEWRGRLPEAERDDWLAQLDVFVHPSLEESFGMVVLEAMAAGLPVIGGAKSGAVPWLIDDAGLCPDVRSPTAVRAALETLASDADERARLSDRALARARQFDLELVRDMYLARLDEIAFGTAGRRA